jgi:hypothetical protein
MEILCPLDVAGLGASRAMLKDDGQLKACL